MYNKSATLGRELPTALAGTQAPENTTVVPGFIRIYTCTCKYTYV